MKYLLLLVMLISSFGVAHSQAHPYLILVVAQDGSGDFLSIQKAITSVRDLGPGNVLIKIKAGIYNEKIVIPSYKHKITLVGDSSGTTIIINSDHSGMVEPKLQEKMTTFNSYTLFIGGDDIKIENLTVKNNSCKEGQAVALHVEGDRFTAVNCTISGCQDTLYAATAHSRQFYKNCHIEGTTDFIFGQATAVFANCTIKNLSESYITAAATTPSQKYGFVFIDCNIIANEGLTQCYLGRPWRPHAKTVFINCTLGKHILPEGWHPWGKDKMFPDKEKTCYYAEYESKGAGSNPAGRVKWSQQLSDIEVKSYNIANILSGTDGWVPGNN